jgi:hypothetical protein
LLAATLGADFFSVSSVPRWFTYFQLMTMV